MKPVKEKAGAVVFRDAHGKETQILVVSARKYENQWIFPVGTVEKGESLDAAARRECQEESGYLVKIGRKLPPVEILSNGAKKRFTFYLATVVGEVDAWETDRKRKWLPVSALVDALPTVFQSVAGQAIALIAS